jgi:hypothetical protein
MGLGHGAFAGACFSSLIAVPEDMTTRSGINMGRSGMADVLSDAFPVIRRQLSKPGRIAVAIVIYIVLGIVSFWGPDILISRLARAAAVDVVGVGLITFVLPGCLLATYGAVRYFLEGKAGPSIALSMLVGIWVGGPICITIAHATSVAGVQALRATDLFTDSLLFFPTFVMATYDGTLAALLIASVAMVVISIVTRTHGRAVPRRGHVQKQ